MGTTQYIQAVDLLDMVELIGRKKRVHQRVILNELEQLIPDRDTFLKVRKVILDHTNDYTRTLVKELFGDSFEDNVK